MSTLQRATHSAYRHLNRIFCRTVARRYVAGPDREDAISYARKLNSRSCRAIINFLGEHLTSTSEVVDAMCEYVSLIRFLSRSTIDASVSLKLSQIGADLRNGWSSVKINLGYICGIASSGRIRVEIDMEHPTTISDTLDVFVEIASSNQFGTCPMMLALPANSWMSDHALSLLSSIPFPHPVGCRIVKGAYPHSEDGLSSEEEVLSHMVDLIDSSLQIRNERFMVAIATHRRDIVSRFLSYKNEPGSPNLEFQVLMGAGNSLIPLVLDSRQRMSVYVPYGERALKYTLRRFRENPRSLIGLITHLLSPTHALPSKNDHSR